MSITSTQLLIGPLLLLLAVGGGAASAEADTPEAEDREVKPRATLTAQDPLQAQFMMAGIAMQNGDYEAAIAILSDLASKTDSPRVRLELGRAYFLARKHREAQSLLQPLYRDREIPFAVRQNIKRYLDEIDNVLGFAKFDFALVTDSNPKNFTSSKEVVIAGQVLTIVPPADNREVRGVRYQVRSGKALSDDGRILGVANLAFTDFERSQFDRWTVDGGLIYAFRTQPRLKSRVGLEVSGLDGDKQYDFAYASAIYTPDPVHQFRLSHELKVGRLHVPMARHLNADSYSMSSTFNRQFDGRVVLKGDLGLELSSAKEDPYSYYGGSVGLGVDYPLNGWWIEVSGAVSRRLYEENDPFFYSARRDTRKKAGIKLEKQNFVIFGYLPEFGVSYERSDSSIDFHSYDKLSFFVGLHE